MGRFTLACFTALALSVSAFAQDTIATAAPVDLPPDSTPSDAVASPSAPPSTYERPISFLKLIPNVASDQKRIWLFPRRLTEKKVLIPTLAIIGATAAFIATDPITGKYFRESTSYDGFNKIFAGSNTAYGTVAVPAAMYLTGLASHNTKMRRTALLAAEAVGDVEIVDIAMKDIDRRLRPASVQNGDYSDTWFKDNTRNFRSNGSFPSGHTIAAFAVANVISKRYGNHRWVPFVAYGLAAGVGFSRMTLSSHWGSDVFMGAALGYGISRFVVLRQ